MPDMGDYGQPDNSGWDRFNRSYETEVQKVVEKTTKKPKKKNEKG